MVPNVRRAILTYTFHKLKLANSIRQASSSSAYISFPPLKYSPAPIFDKTVTVSLGKLVFFDLVTFQNFFFDACSISRDIVLQQK